jgi:hypothetical protein
MALLRTLVLTPTFDLVREPIVNTNVVEYRDSQTAHLFNRAQRPAYRFTLKLEPLLRLQHENLSAFYAFHQGGKSFMYDGGPYSTTENYQLMAEGNSATRQFFIPNRWIGAGSYSVQTKNQITLTTSIWSTGVYSVNLNPGILTFQSGASTTPSSGHDIEAKYACAYRVVFEKEFKVAEFAKGIFRTEVVLREVFLF